MSVAPPAEITSGDTPQRLLRLLQQDEDELLRASQAGDDEAFGALMYRMDAPVRRYTRRLIGDTADEDDIVQDVFITLYQKMARIDAERGLRPYLFRMVRNRSYDLLRRQKRFQTIPLEEEPPGPGFTLLETLPDEGETPEEVAHWLMLGLEVREAMERLPENQRQALILFAEEEFSYEEIAEAVNTSVGTVRSRLFHARRTLRRMLDSQQLLTLLDGASHREEARV